ncbi:MAG: thrombospondin type 3 repeat-containing protein, partial [Cellvibrionaceae bacterium]|nr:thrombospondin type 3 repeat-containing protein [Cellvibrionaceae bacterium]
MKASILVSLLLLASQCLIFTNQTYAQVYYQRDDNGRLLEVGFIKAPAHVQAQAQAALAERKRSPVLVDPHNGGWSVYDNASGSAAISMFSDPKRGDGVIQLAGDGHGDGYRLGAADGGPWYDTENQIFQWSMKYSEFFTIYITVETNDGIYYMVYTPVEGHHITHSSIVNYGLGKSARNGQWQTFTRDLLYDLDYARPTIELIAILGFQIRGSGLLQNVKALPSFPAGLDADRDGITDNQEIQHYETNPYRADSDGDAIADGDELNYWGDSWQDDSDGDLLPDLRDPDSDNDGLVDGAEIAAGSDPRDRLSVAQQLVYEDGSGAARWDMYDNSPVGASIRSVTDAGRAGQVVRLRGSAISNGFRLRYPDQHWWNNRRHKSLRWS